VIFLEVQRVISKNEKLKPLNVFDRIEKVSKGKKKQKI
jgi:hypothetical protein